MQAQIQNCYVPLCLVKKEWGLFPLQHLLSKKVYCEGRHLSLAQGFSVKLFEDQDYVYNQSESIFAPKRHEFARWNRFVSTRSLSLLLKNQLLLFHSFQVWLLLPNACHTFCEKSNSKLFFSPECFQFSFRCANNASRHRLSRLSALFLVVGLLLPFQTGFFITYLVIYRF